MRFTRWFGPVVLITLVAAGCGGNGKGSPAAPLSGLSADRIVDLTHPFDESTIYWPTDTEGFRLEEGTAGMTEKGYFYAANRLSLAEHGGTHIDAPYHFFETGKTVDELSVDRLIGAGIVVDVRDRCRDDVDYRVLVEDLKSWESEHGRIPEDAIVFLLTGHGAFWPDRVRYMATEDLGPEAVAKLHFPGLHPDAATWLTTERSIAAVGLDTPSIDYGQSTLFESHQVLFAEEIPAFENLANLDQLPETGFIVIALPMKIAGGSGGPLRIVAIVP